jgi:hypothetical protein
MTGPTQLPEIQRDVVAGRETHASVEGVPDHSPPVEFRREAQQAFKECPYMMSVKHVSETLGISRASIYRLAERGDLRVTKATLTGDSPSLRIVRDSAVDLLAEWLAAGNED